MAAEFGKKGRFAVHASEDEALHLFKIEADEEATRLDYEGQLINYQEEFLNREIDSLNGIRPRPVQWANLSRGFVLTVLGSGLLATHFVLGLWALSWIEMGWKSYAAAGGVSIGGALGTAFLLQGVLKIFKRHQHGAHTLFVTFLAAAVMIMSMFCSANLGRFRAELASMNIEDTSAPVTINGEKVNITGQSDSVSRFYARTLPSLGLLFVVMAIFLDLASGITLHVGLDKMGTAITSLKMLKSRDTLARKKVVNASLRDTVHLTPEKRLFDFRMRKEKSEEEAIRREERAAYRASPEFKNKKIAVGLIIFMLSFILLLLFASRGWPDMVVGIDMSLSEKRSSVTGHDSLEVRKRTVENLIQRVGPGESFYVLAITGNSRADPWIILSARLDKNPGFFSERTRKGRALLTAAWRKASGRLKLFSNKTDILGFLHVAGELLRGSGVIYVLSDGKNCTKELNLEKPPKNGRGYMGKVNKIRGLPHLKGIKVRWFGAGGPGTSRFQLESLEQFWRVLIERSGGRLACFSSLKGVTR